jgi:hypothetical protein
MYYFPVFFDAALGNHDAPGSDSFGGLFAGFVGVLASIASGVG